MTTRPRSSRVLLLLGLAAVVALLLSPGWVPPLLGLVNGSRAEGQAADPPAGPKGGADFVVCFGYADAENGITPLQPTQPGRVREVLFRENDEVPAGAVLLRLDDTTAQARVREAEGVLAAAKVQLVKAVKGVKQHGVRLAQQRAAIDAVRSRIVSSRHALAARQKKQSLQSPGRAQADPVEGEEILGAAARVKELEAEEQVELRKLDDLELLDPVVEVDRADAEVAQADARLQQARQVLQEHIVCAPTAGKILRVFVTPGELLTVPSKRPAVQFCPDGRRVIRCEVEQAFVKRVRAGGVARVEDDTNPGVTWKGTVVRLADWYTQRRLIAEEQLQMRDVRTVEFIVVLEPGQPPLRIGQRVRVVISPPTP